MKRKKQKFLFIVGMLFLLFCILVSAGTIKTKLFICWNFSASEPRGIYRIVPLDKLKSGDMVVMRVPENMREYVYGRGWSREGVDLLKTVCAVEGDLYSITDAEISINGKYVGPVFEKDRQGLDLPVLRGNFIVKQGHFLPLALMLPTSFDGRYFGEVPVELVVYKVEPFLIIEDLLKKGE